MALTLGDNFSYQGAKPLDARLTYSTVAAMKAVADATMYNGCMAYCTETDKTYQWKSANTVDETTGKWREFSSGGGGGGGTSYTAGDGIDITGNVISTEKSEEGAIDEIIDRYPTGGELVSIVNAFNKGDLYSTDERMIGQWIDGKPLYQKTVSATIPTAKENPTLVDIGASVDFAMVAEAVYDNGSGAYIETPAIGGNLTSTVRMSVFNNSFSESARKNKFQIEQVSTTAMMGGNTVYAVLKYTKTTDQVVSIGEANEYSTSEKIIGTWIDGSPIYQKTFEFTVPTTYNSDVIIYTGNTNERIKYAWGALVTSTEDSVTLNSPYNGTARTALHWNKNVLTCRISEWGGSNAYVTIQYTKAT